MLGEGGVRERQAMQYAQQRGAALAVTNYPSDAQNGSLRIHAQTVSEWRQMTPACALPRVLLRCIARSVQEEAVAVNQWRHDMMWLTRCTGLLLSTCR